MAGSNGGGPPQYRDSSPSGMHRMGPDGQWIEVTPTVEVPKMDGLYLPSKLVNWIGGIASTALVAAWLFIWQIHIRQTDQEKQLALLQQDIVYIKDGVHRIEQEVTK